MIYDQLIERMDLSGLKSFSRKEIYSFNGITKKQLADMAIPQNITYDTAIPQPFVDAFIKEYKGIDYHFFISTTFTLYSSDRNISGMIWSCCDEIQGFIIQFINKGSK